MVNHSATIREWKVKLNVMSDLKMNGNFVWSNKEKTKVKFVYASEKTSSETIKGFSRTIDDKTS